jgi:hypothetical protein
VVLVKYIDWIDAMVEGLVVLLFTSLLVLRQKDVLI